MINIDNLSLEQIMGEEIELFPLMDERDEKIFIRYSKSYVKNTNSKD